MVTWAKLASLIEHFQYDSYSRLLGYPTPIFKADRQIYVDQERKRGGEGERELGLQPF